MDENAALDALSAQPGEQAAQPSAPSEGQPGATPQSQAQPETVDSFTNIDPSGLSPELQAIYKSMQTDYVRKTQTIAQQREEAQQAIEFAQKLAYDSDFQQQMYVNLRQHLEGQGVLPAEAHAAAAAQTGLDDTPDENWDYEDPRVDELSQKVQQFESYMQNQAVEKQRNDIIQNLNSQEAVIRQSNPAYQQEDIDDIYRLAHATNADLTQAQQVYEGIRSRQMAAYLSTKAGVNANTPSVPNMTQHGEQPTQFKNLDDPALESAAAAMIAANFAN